jgi:FixJ family two-component response regulator
MEIKARILVVDDNYDLCESIKDVLGENDYHVECAANGKDGIELTRNNKYDIALIGVKLPDISGNEVVEKIAEVSPSAEFIYMTGHATINSAIEAVKQERVVSYETKPLDPNHLLALINQIAERKKAEKRLKAHYLVTRVLAEAITIRDAFSKILETICTALEWDIGEIWIIDQQENILRNAEIWHIPSFKIPEFKAITKQITFPLQIGLPGRVWECAKPLWIEDVVRDTNFLRASVATKEGVHAAFGFPILSGSKVLGTINFFSHELKNPDKYLLNMMSAIGTQIGLFIKRKQAEELLYVQKKDLENKNIALGEVLGQIELEKKQIKDNVIANAENLLLPIIQKLRLKGESRKYVQILKKNLQELTSSFGTKLTNKKAKLTSREIEICDMVKNGLTSKEIASLLNINLRTTEKHRANIRNKLGIIKKDISLTSFLKTL